mgnify:CR=1 FL=1
MTQDALDNAVSGGTQESVERLDQAIRAFTIGHAQRDIVDWTLTVAALRGGHKALALGLAYERLAGRPESLINRRFHDEAERIAS